MWVYAVNRYRGFVQSPNTFILAILLPGSAVVSLQSLSFDKGYSKNMVNFWHAKAVSHEIAVDSICYS